MNVDQSDDWDMDRMEKWQWRALGTDSGRRKILGTLVELQALDTVSLFIADLPSLES